MWADRRAPAAPVWLLILALHAGVLALLNTRPRPTAAHRDWSELRLIPFRPAQAPMPAPVLPIALPRLPVPDVAPVTGPAPAAPDAAGPAPADTPPDTVPAAPAAEAPPPLRLTLPSLADAARRQPALDDPRANTPISRMGARIANDLGGDGRWVEERMDADFVRLRRGNTCINLHRNRTAGRQPFDESSTPTPWGATPSYRCERR